MCQNITDKEVRRVNQNGQTQTTIELVSTHNGYKKGLYSDHLYNKIYYLWLIQ